MSEIDRAFDVVRCGAVRRLRIHVDRARWHFREPIFSEGRFERVNDKFM